MIENTSEKCIWLTNDTFCELMKSCHCGDLRCSFRQTAAEKQQSETNWQNRMDSLPMEEQRKIAQKYYGGDMPWKA